MGGGVKVRFRCVSPNPVGLGHPWCGVGGCDARSLSTGPSLSLVGGMWAPLTLLWLG